MIYGPTGFMQSPNEHQLEISAKLIDGDVLQRAQVGQRLGLLGIELATRRRNRLSARLSASSSQGMTLDVLQSFGNCPQYIQSRDFQALEAQDKKADTQADKQQEFSTFDEKAMALIGNADTFFVASYYSDNDQADSNGADISHRGGLPGFIRIDSKRQLTIPDYLGNFHFNTLGNLLLNPRAGLLFIDFESGDILQLTGRTEILWGSTDTEFFAGAERLWTFHLDHGVRIKSAIKGIWSRLEFSPNTHLTGTWQSAEDKRLAQQARLKWRDFEVTTVVPESSVVTSYYLRPKQGACDDFSPGQFLTLKASIDATEQIRTYTVSSQPGAESYRISIKRDGLFSSYMTDSVVAGSILKARAPSGNFHLRQQVSGPLVFVAAGIGITPMLSMIRFCLDEALRRRQPRQMVLIAGARNAQQRAFYKELQALQSVAAGALSVYWCLSDPESKLKCGYDFDFVGRINSDILGQCLPSSTEGAYLCGPSAFMQSAYDALLSYGISDKQVSAEAFGPSSLKRQSRRFNKASPIEASVLTVVNNKGKVVLEQGWADKDGSLLEFVEDHGVQADFACRSGQCGACAAALVTGGVVYSQEASANIQAGQVLLCSAKPASKKLTIKLNDG